MASLTSTSSLRPGFLHRILKRPVRTVRLLRAFARHMKTADLLRLLFSPFRRRVLTRKPELPARMVDAGLEEPDRRAATPELTVCPPLLGASEQPLP